MDKNREKKEKKTKKKNENLFLNAKYLVKLELNLHRSHRTDIKIIERKTKTYCIPSHPNTT